MPVATGKIEDVEPQYLTVNPLNCSKKNTQKFAYNNHKYNLLKGFP